MAIEGGSGDGVASEPKGCVNAGVRSSSGAPAGHAATRRPPRRRCAASSSDLSITEGVRPLDGFLGTARPGLMAVEFPKILQKK